MTDSSAPAGRRRRRAHPAATARILTAGVSASAGFGIVTALALSASPPGSGSVTTTDITDPAVAPTTAAATLPTIVVRRYIPVPVEPGTTPATVATPPAARQPRPARPLVRAPAAAPQQAPKPNAVTRGSG